MGMITVFRRLPHDDLSRLQREPELMEGYLAEQGSANGFGEFADLNLDKAWHAIHFLLTGTAMAGEPPLNFIATGGTEVGDDLGYGPARTLGAAEVEQLAQALTPLTTETLMQRFDPGALTAAQIYPSIWARPAEEDDTRGYVAAYYEQLRQFVLEAARAREALVISVV